VLGGDDVSASRTAILNELTIPVSVNGGGVLERGWNKSFRT